MISIERFMIFKKVTISSGAVAALRLLVSKTTNGNFGMTVPISKRTGKPLCSSSSRSTKEKRRRLNSPGVQRLRPSRTIAGAVGDLIIAIAHESFARQTFDRGELRDAARSRYSHYFTAKVVQA